MLEKKVLCKFQNSTLLSDNIILGDKLKSAYACLENYFINVNPEEFINEVHLAMNLLVKNSISAETTRNMAKVTKECNYFLEQSLQKLNELYKCMSEKKSHKGSISDRARNMCIDIDNNLEEIKIYAERFENLSNSNKMLTETHEKSSKLLLQIEASKKSLEDQEVLCENCNKRFKEKENFNWSCKRHAGIWSGANYWCCGSMKKDSLGCIISHHLSKSSEKSTTIDKTRVKCSTCREKGHTFAECMREPNCMNPIFFKNPKIEIERLFMLKKLKARNKISSKPLKREAQCDQEDFLEIENLREYIVKGEPTENNEIQDLWLKTPQSDANKAETFSLPPLYSPRVVLPKTPQYTYSFNH